MNPLPKWRGGNSVAGTPRDTDLGSPSPGPDNGPTATNSPPTTLNLTYTATARDGLSTTWEATEYITNALTGAVTTKPHKYIEIASGLNYVDPANGQYQPSQDLIELTAEGGAAAVRGQAKLYLKPNLNTLGAITLVTVSNRVFTTRPLGIFWFNAQSGQAQLIAPVQDCVGQLVPPNQVVWKSAFGPIADLRLTFTKSGIESDLVLLQQPVPPASWDPRTTRLELWHDWTGAPTPAVKPNVLYTETDPTLRPEMLEPDFTDQILDFGDFWFPTGAGFAADGKPDLATNAVRQVRVPNLAADSSLTGVGKTWLATPTVDVLVEGVRWPDVQPKVASLALAATAPPTAQPLDRFGLLGQLPAPNAAPIPGQAITVAAGSYHPAGFVWDWIAVPPSTNSWSFDSGQTYYVSGSSTFGGSVTFNPNCTIKFTNGAYLIVYAYVTCNGTSANPSLLTTCRDGLFGETISGSGCDTCCPVYMASPAFWGYHPNYGMVLTGFRVRWAQTAIQFDDSCAAHTHSVSASIFEECQTGVRTYNCSAAISSSTRSDVTTPTAYTGQYGCGSIIGSLTDIGSIDGDNNGLADSIDYKYFGRTNTLPGHVVGVTGMWTNGYSPSTDQPIWVAATNAPPPGPTYTYNTGCWLYGVTGLTAFSPWHTDHSDWNPPFWYYQGGGTLITPQHAITIGHMAFPTNDHVRFVDSGNNVYEREVKGGMGVTAHNNADPYWVMILDRPLPASVEHVRILPPEAYHKLTQSMAKYYEVPACPSGNLPLVGFGALKQAFIVDATSLILNGTYSDPGFTVHHSVWFPDWGSWWYRTQGSQTDAVGGDSGSPVFVLIQNELVLIGPWQSTGGGPWTGDLISNLTDVINALDTQYLGHSSGYAPSLYPLSNFPDLW